MSDESTWDTRVGSETLNTRQGNNTCFANIIWKLSEQRVGSVLKCSSLFLHFLSSGKFLFLIGLQSFRSSLLVILRLSFAEILLVALLSVFIVIVLLPSSFIHDLCPLLRLWYNSEIDIMLVDDHAPTEIR